MSVVALDVGGTAVKGGRAGGTGQFEAVREWPTPGGGTDGLVAALIAAANELRTDDVTAVGVVVPGVVTDGIVRFAANLPLRNVDLRSRLATELGLPVAVGHDVAAAAEAEAAAGAGDDLLFVASGTGVAAARVRGGRADRGSTGQAGELGHVVVVPAGEPCACGNRGCVEVYASGASIGRRYREVSGISGADASYVASVLGSDRLAAVVWQEAVDALAAGIVAAIVLLDPGAVVVGGGLAQAGEVLLEPLRKAIDERLTWRDAPPVRAGLLGTSAGRFGAARLALQLVTDAKERTA